MTPNSPVQNDGLHKACASGHILEIKRLLHGGADPNAYDEQEHTALSKALISGRHDIYNVVESLLSHGADANMACGPEEEFPLNLVMKHVSADTAELVALRLIQNGADPDLRDRSLRNSYDYALGRRYMQVARVVDDQLSVNEAVHKLLDQRLEIDSRQLILAIQQGRQDDVDRCLARGANVNHIDANGAGPIHYLVALSPLEKVEALEMLFREGADVDLLTYEGDSALNLAIKNKSLRWNGELMDVISFLLKNGARTDFRDLDGKDAHDLAEEAGYLDILDRLQNIYPSKESLLEQIPIDSFVNLDLEYTDFWEGLIRRIQNDSLDEFRRFVEDARIDMNDKVDEEGNTSLHLCILREDSDSVPDLIDILMEHGANVNAKNQREETPLHLAAVRGSTPIVKRLLHHRAHDGTEDFGGKTPEERAFFNKHFEVVKVLKLHKQKRNSAIYGDMPEATTVTLGTISEEPTEDTEDKDENKKKKGKNQTSKSCTIL